MVLAVKRDDLVIGYLLGALSGAVLMWLLLSQGFTPVVV